MTIKEFVEQRKKIAGKEKAMEEIESMLKSFSKDDRKRVITPFGTEIHSTESVISSKVRPLTLRDKLMELEQLSQRVMDRKILEATLADMSGDDDPEFTDEDELDIEEDLSFGARENAVIEDENGDKHISVAEPAPAGKVADIEQPMPAAEVSGDEPVSADE